MFRTLWNWYWHGPLQQVGWVALTLCFCAAFIGAGAEPLTRFLTITFSIGCIFAVMAKSVLGKETQILLKTYRPWQRLLTRVFQIFVLTGFLGLAAVGLSGLAAEL